MAPSIVKLDKRDTKEEGSVKSEKISSLEEITKTARDAYHEDCEARDWYNAFTAEKITRNLTYHRSRYDQENLPREFFEAEHWHKMVSERDYDPYAYIEYMMPVLRSAAQGSFGGFAKHGPVILSGIEKYFGVKAFAKEYAQAQLYIKYLSDPGFTKEDLTKQLAQHADKKQ